MMSTETKRLRITAREESASIVIRFEVTGVGVTSSAQLFRPFQRGAESSGIGLYVSRAIMRSFGGDIAYERNPQNPVSPWSYPCTLPPRKQSMPKTLEQTVHILPERISSDIAPLSTPPVTRRTFSVESMFLGQSKKIPAIPLTEIEVEEYQVDLPSAKHLKGLFNGPAAGNDFEPGLNAEEPTHTLRK